MQDKQPTGTPPAKDETKNQMAQNPNPRANENIDHTPFEKKDANDGVRDVGSEITDGEGG